MSQGLDLFHRFRGVEFLGKPWIGDQHALPEADPGQHNFDFGWNMFLESETLASEGSKGWRVVVVVVVVSVVVVVVVVVVVGRNKGSRPTKLSIVLTLELQGGKVRDTVEGLRECWFRKQVDFF